MANVDTDYRYHHIPEVIPPILGDFRNKNVLSMSQFDRESLEKVFSLASEIDESLHTTGRVPKMLEGKLLLTWFGEPSTRTRMSFESAHLRLGGQQPMQLLEMHSLDHSSFDYSVLSVASNMPDMIIMRSKEKGVSEIAAKIIQDFAKKDIPIINAGDGTGEHPTQALLDLYTIKKQKGRLDNLKGVIAGDPIHQRALHSLLDGFSRYENNHLYLFSDPKLGLTEDDLKRLSQKGLTITPIQSGRQIPQDCDFWYWTRVPKERFETEEEFEAVKNRQRLTPNLIRNRGNKDMIIMHVGPITDEVDHGVYNDPRFIYFDQVANGVPVRGALMALVLGTEVEKVKQASE